MEMMMKCDLTKKKKKMKEFHERRMSNFNLRVPSSLVY